MNQLIRNLLPKTTKEWIWFVIIILLVIGLGSFALNQMVSVQYKIHALQNACQICESYGNRCEAVINLSQFVPFK